MFINRIISTRLSSLAQQFTAVAIFGPRQSGKTTLAKEVFKDYLYFSFEDLNNRFLIKADPKAFLEKYKDVSGLILDEVQHVPELLSYIQTHIDTYKKKGHFIITGSQNLLLNQSITQSLAGRIAILTLLPLSVSELKNSNFLPKELDKFLVQGSYPSIYADKIDATDWYSFYINTYVEKDVRQIKNIGDLSLFQKFMKLCAGRIGQELNLSSLSNDLGLSATTVRQWLSILEATYIIFLLQPYYKNFNKRVIKSPKLYFYDTGLAASLLGINDFKNFFMHYMRGSIFENLIISDFKKQYYNLGKQPEMYFWRDQTQYEIDCLLDSNKLIPLEIKSGSTYNTHFLDNFTKFNVITKTDSSENILIYAGEQELNTSKGKIINWQNCSDLINNIL